METITYRGVEIAPNFRSIHGTGALLAKPRGYNLYLNGHAGLGWTPSLKAARALIDYLHAGGASKQVAAALQRVQS